MTAGYRVWGRAAYKDLLAVHDRDGMKLLGMRIERTMQQMEGLPS